MKITAWQGIALASLTRDRVSARTVPSSRTLIDIRVVTALVIGASERTGS